MSNKKPTSRKERTTQTRRAILDAARELITEKGAHNLSLREIARRIEYSPAGLYEYFGNKEEIIQTVIGEGFQKFGSYMFAVPTDLPAEIYLRQLGLAYVTFALENPEHYILIFSRPQLQTDTFMASGYVADGTFQTLVGGLERAVEQGVLPESLDLEAASFGSWSMVHGMAMLLLTQMKQLQSDWKPMANEMLDNWFLGMTTHAWEKDKAKSE